jgi:uncharacterized protein (DUF2267 family)
MPQTTVDYREFVETVRDEACISDDEAERAACATLHVIAERITPGEAEDLAEKLPGELKACLDAAGVPEPFHLDEFLRRVAERLELDRSAAERDARGVFAALWHTVGPKEFADLRAQLPKDFDALIDEALRDAPPPPRLEAEVSPGLSYDEFLERVAERAGLDRAGAERAAGAVLEVLAIRITGGEVEDIEAMLPREMRPPLERGRAVSESARPLSLDTFLAEIARREGVDRGAAKQDARAVFLTLREAIGEDEFHDVMAQLPDEYRELWRRGQSRSRSALSARASRSSR